MKKILITGEYPLAENRRRGGIETVTFNTAESLSRETTFDVHVLCIREGLLSARERRVGNVTVHEIPGLPLPHSITMYTWDYFLLRRAIRQINPDFIHAQSQDRYALAAIRSGIPMVMSIHGLFFKQSELLEGSAIGRYVRKFLWNRIERYCIRRAPSVIVMNEYVGAVARKLARGDVHFVHNPINDAYFLESGIRMNKDPSTGNTVLFAGMISKRKYLEKLLEVASLVIDRNPNVRFRVAGKAQDKQYYREIVQLSKKLGIAERVDFLGFIPETELIEEYKGADLFVLTSKEDTSPMAVAQAMAAGLPVVASRIGGIPELIEDGVTGFLGDNDRPEGLARSILEILQDPLLRSRLGSSAAEKASELFTERAVSKRLEKIYETSRNAQTKTAKKSTRSKKFKGKAFDGFEIKEKNGSLKNQKTERKTKILIVGPVSPPFGGVESVVETLLGSELAHNYRLYHLSTRKKLGTSAAKGRFGFSNILYGFYHILKILYYIIMIRPALVHMPVTSNLPGFTRDALFIKICSLFRCPVTGHLHGGSFDKFLLKASSRKRRFILRSLGSLHTLIVLSRYWKELLEADLPDTKITIVHNAIGPEWLIKAKGRNSESITVLFVGSLGKRKGVFEILKAAEILGRDRDDIHFNIVGTEERLGEKEQLDALFVDLGLSDEQVSFPGALYGEDKMNAYRDADIFILPAYNEAFPIVILEAFGSGLPVISCPVGSIPEVIKDGENGYLVEPGDYNSLAARIRHLADNRHLRIRMGKYNQKVLEENYIAERMVERIDSVYRSILGLTKTNNERSLSIR